MGFHDVVHTVNYSVDFVRHGFEIPNVKKKVTYFMHSYVGYYKSDQKIKSPS